MIIEIGRLCVKIAGRDAGKKALITDILDDKYVLIDGETRRRKCNILHLEPLSQVLKIEKNASHEEVAKALKEIGIEARETKPKQKTERPRKKRKTAEELRLQKGPQKEDKKKLRDVFKPKKKERKEGTLEEKAGIAEKEESKETEGKQAEKKEIKKSEKKGTKVMPAKKSEKKKED